MKRGRPSVLHFYFEEIERAIEGMDIVMDVSREGKELPIKQQSIVFVMADGFVFEVRLAEEG